MNEIRKCLICGIGAVGSIYANKINEFDDDFLRVLVDEDRLEKYKKAPKVFNGKPLNFNYILPNATDYKADLIIIATKFDGLCDAIKNIENFVKEDTIILSLLNGVSSEELIAKKYGWKHIPISYFIGHSAMRDGATTLKLCKQTGLENQKELFLNSL
jgi:2-dehydropantoate 2-reductase